VISKRRFVHKLHKLGYEFKEQLHFQDRYRLHGGTHVIHVPRKDELDEVFVCSTLKQAGQTKIQIEEFLGDASV